MIEDALDITALAEIRSRTIAYLGIGAIVKVNDILENLKSRGISSILIVTGKSSYKSSGAWAHVEKALKNTGFTFAVYDGVTPNPEVDQVDAAVAAGKRILAEAVMGIGGGSPIDAAKSAAILLEYRNNSARDLFEGRLVPQKAVPIIAINLTHGTGTEVNRFAVVTVPEKNFKPPIAFDCIYPLYSIDDPALMTGLSASQTLFVSIDAMNHAIEAATTKVANHYSICMATEAVRLVAAYLPDALRDPLNLRARYFLTYAALYAGIAFDNGLLHLTHALEHPLSGLKPQIIHGHGLSLLLPSIIKHIYPEKSKILADVLSPIVPGLNGTADEKDKAAAGVKDWLQKMGVTMGLRRAGFVDADILTLTDLTSSTLNLDLLLSLSPSDSGKSAVESIYRESMD